MGYSTQVKETLRMCSCVLLGFMNIMSWLTNRDTPLVYPSLPILFIVFLYHGLTFTQAGASAWIILSFFLHLEILTLQHLAWYYLL